MTTTPLSGQLIIPRRFNGPAQSANGGYTCGLVSTMVEGVAEVTLRSPPPLDVPLEVARTPGRFEVLDGTTLVATARQISFEPLDIPVLPSWDEAAAASQDYLGHMRHEFPTCFTCGTERSDGLAIYPGPTATGMVASPWIPDGSLPNEEGALDVAIVWAALDCPGAWADARDLAEDPVVLGRMTAVVDRPIAIGRRYIAVAWKLGEEGRKSFAATALIDDEGQAVAVARQTWIGVVSSQ
jgi:hypothetical protein